MANIDVANLILCFMLIIIVVPSCIFLYMLIKESTSPEEGFDEDDFYNYRTLRGEIHTEGIYKSLDSIAHKNLDLKDYAEGALRQLQKMALADAVIRDFDYILDYPRFAVEDKSYLVSESAASLIQKYRTGVIKNCRTLINSVTCCNKKVEDILLEDLNTEELDSLLSENNQLIDAAIDVLSCYIWRDRRGKRKFNSVKFKKLLQASKTE